MHCRILFSVFAGTRSGFGKFCFVFNTTSPFCPRPLGPYFARDMIGKRTRTSPFLLDFQGVSGFVLIITYGHTFATHALTSGVDAKTLSGILGHTKASFTLDTYTHVTGDMHRRAAEIVGGFMNDIMVRG